VSSTILTPAELSSKARNLSCKVRRIVEAQHMASTSRIVDTIAEHVVFVQSAGQPRKIHLT